ncbi:hypothetical protein FOXYSP1_05680 [Fusarium oxysporum f. sp. phaseoli]
MLCGPAAFNTSVAINDHNLPISTYVVIIPGLAFDYRETSSSTSRYFSKLDQVLATDKSPDSSKLISAFNS